MVDYFNSSSLISVYQEVLKFKKMTIKEFLASFPTRERNAFKFRALSKQQKSLLLQQADSVHPLQALHLLTIPIPQCFDSNFHNISDGITIAQQNLMVRGFLNLTSLTVFGKCEIFNF